MEINWQQRLFLILFPLTPRDFPGRRALRSLLRTVHIFTIGILLGGHVFAQPDFILFPWAIAAVLTGLLMLATDLHASFAFILEVRGVAVLCKIFLTLLVAVFPQHAFILLTTVLVIGSISSHMPGRYRHRLLWLNDKLAADKRHG